MWKPRCDECYYVKKVVSQINPHGMKCLYNPPVLMELSIPGDNRIISMLPKVEPGDFCRHWKGNK